MGQPPTRTSLLTRVVHDEERARIIPRRPRDAQPRQQSFAERYRGTEWDAPSVVSTAKARPVRGRMYVWVMLAALLATAALVLAASHP